MHTNKITEKMNVEPIRTHLDQILDRELLRGQKNFKIVGTSSSTAAAFLISQLQSKSISKFPNLIVFATEAEARKFQISLEFFDPTIKTNHFASFDVSPYSTIMANSRAIAQRVGFLHAASLSTGGEIFISSIDALQQKTLPFSVLKKHTFNFKKNDSLPENFSEILSLLGYIAEPLVEDYGQFAMRGGIIDIYSPAHPNPIRLELFGDQIESIRYFSAEDQSSLGEISNFYLIPAREVLFLEENYEALVKKYKEHLSAITADAQEKEEILHSLLRKNYFVGVDFLIPYFYPNLSTAFDFFNSELNVWLVDDIDIKKVSDDFLLEMKTDSASSKNEIICPPFESLFISYENLLSESDHRFFHLSNLHTEMFENSKSEVIDFKTLSTTDFSNLLLTHSFSSEGWLQAAKAKIQTWKNEGYRIFISIKNKNQLDRIKHSLENMDYIPLVCEEGNYTWDTWLLVQKNKDYIHLINNPLIESLKFVDEKIIFLRDEDFLGKKDKFRNAKPSEDFNKKAKRLSFGDLKPNDFVVHVQHGIGVYEGLKVMNIGGVESEYIQLSYKDKDKLYLPVYRVNQLQKYAGASAHIVPDKLGGATWEKVKTKVRSSLKDIASDLLKLYAERAQLTRAPFNVGTDDYKKFEDQFPFEETQDQLNSLEDIRGDLTSQKPMDRLICGDVGFGKTEVAMRAAFLAIQEQKQVAVLAPTTVLSFQHVESFKKRFKNWPVEIRALNRFVSNSEIKKTLDDVKSGKVDILIGTHRVLSKDVQFKNLGMLIVDEEHKFGVVHKEKVKKLKTSIDTLTLSATPIPRTLNMSLVGVRDLSLINTPPVDRLPTRTFICKFDAETIQKAVRSEISRGGQVYFIHNRVQSIYSLADELRELLPEVRMKVGHGQMEEDQLEETMVDFFEKKIDMLICTTIVESGMDVSSANTIFIDQAHMLGLSQLYQLRGRVGRSKQRAYCYLLLPKSKTLDKDAQERLKVLQDNTALGSGIRIAQYDLELRGSGNILGDDQSGHVSSVGYEMYMDLLGEAIQRARGETVKDKIDPEINLRIPALIPDSYIPDIRLRLSYYKALSDIQNISEIDQIENELRDQFGAIPEPVVNLMGIMMIRSVCKTLGIKDLTAGVKNVSLIFSQDTPIATDTFVKLAMRSDKKYSLMPNNKFTIKLKEVSWSVVYEELLILKDLNK